MGIDGKLAFLEQARRFTVKRDGIGYEVRHAQEREEYPVVACYDQGHGWSYYVGGVYNNGTDYAEIDMERLAELAAFCELLGGGE